MMLSSCVWSMEFVVSPRSPAPEKPRPYPVIGTRKFRALISLCLHWSIQVFKSVYNCWFFFHVRKTRIHKWSTFLPVFWWCRSRYQECCLAVHTYKQVSEVAKPGFWEKHSKETQGDIANPSSIPQREVLKHSEPPRPEASLFWEQIQAKNKSPFMWSLLPSQC